jgi:hypothetical protein
MIYKYKAIIIEPRKHKALEFVLNNILECLSNDWGIVFFCGINNYDYSTHIVNKLNTLFDNRILLIKLEIENLDGKSYSKLLATKTIIYDYIDTEYFLVFQTDPMMFKSNCHLMNNFLNKGYDYVGAPWLVCEYQPTKNRSFIGNGGFSLRKTETMLKIIANYAWDENNEWHEDLFFTKPYEDITLNKPSYSDALTFCVDEVPHSITMACHNFWRHPHVYEHMKSHYPECEILKNLQCIEEDII